jgi:hypothetical protein
LADTKKGRIYPLPFSLDRRPCNLILLNHNAFSPCITNAAICSDPLRFSAAADVERRNQIEMDDEEGTL